MPSPHRLLFAGLVDDAALFPPGNAPMATALAEHARHRSSSYAGLVGPFLCPATRVEELRATLPAQQPLSLSLVVDAGAQRLVGGVRAGIHDEGERQRLLRGQRLPQLLDAGGRTQERADQAGV